VKIVGVACPASAASKIARIAGPNLQRSIRKSRAMVSVTNSSERVASVIVLEFLFEMHFFVMAQLPQFSIQQSLVYLLGKGVRLQRSFPHEINKINDLAERCIGNSNAILLMTTVARVPPFHSCGTHAQRRASGAAESRSEVRA
jgi:hypothetical protein